MLDSRLGAAGSEVHLRQGRVRLQRGRIELQELFAAGAGRLERTGAAQREVQRQREQPVLRIREGGFGECVSCGEEINAKRLEAVPWTRYCIACQEKLESGQLEEARE